MCLGVLLEFPGCGLVWIFRCELRLRFDVWCSLLIMLPVGWYNIVLLYLGRFWWFWWLVVGLGGFWWFWVVW